jgi:hypothetical protein
MRTAVQFAYQSPVEIRRQARDGRGHGTPQQTIERGFAGFHLSHKNILFLSACHGEAGARDADTI